MLDSFSSEELVSLAVAGDENAMAEIIRRFSPMVNAIATGFSASFEKEDLSQEGMFGLLSAIYAYKSDVGASFSTFAGACVRNRILNAVKAFSKQCSSIPCEDFATVADVYSDPQEICLDQERSAELSKKISDRLSDFEKAVLDLFVCGFSYYDISKRLGCSEKSVDNAIQRARSKLK